MDLGRRRPKHLRCIFASKQIILHVRIAHLRLSCASAFLAMLNPGEATAAVQHIAIITEPKTYPRSTVKNIEQQQAAEYIGSKKHTLLMAACHWLEVEGCPRKEKKGFSLDDTVVWPKKRTPLMRGWFEHWARTKQHHRRHKSRSNAHCDASAPWEISKEKGGLIILSSFGIICSSITSIIMVIIYIT